MYLTIKLARCFRQANNAARYCRVQSSALRALAANALMTAIHPSELLLTYIFPGVGCVLALSMFSSSLAAVL